MRSEPLALAALLAAGAEPGRVLHLAVETTSKPAFFA